MINFVKDSAARSAKLNVLLSKYEPLTLTVRSSIYIRRGRSTYGSSGNQLAIARLSLRGKFWRGEVLCQNCAVTFSLRVVTDYSELQFRYTEGIAPGARRRLVS